MTDDLISSKYRNEEVSKEVKSCKHIEKLYSNTLQHAPVQPILLQVNEKFCELKGGNIGIVEKAQETRFGMS